MVDADSMQQSFISARSLPWLTEILAGTSQNPLDIPGFKQILNQFLEAGQLPPGISFSFVLIPR